MGRNKTPIDKWWSWNGQNLVDSQTGLVMTINQEDSKLIHEAIIISAERVDRAYATFMALTTPPPLGTDSRMEEGME